MTKSISIMVVSDIFGRTDALEDFCAALGSVSQIIDPYHGSKMAFSDEAEAYQYFITEVGLEPYAEKVLSACSTDQSITYLIGFSAGASAIWLNSARLSQLGVTQAVCFYGSQIRHATDIEPDIDLKVVMPRNEPHFSVGQLATLLASKPSVQILHTDYLHGFMNKLSSHFSPDAYAFYLNWLKTDLDQC